MLKTLILAAVAAIAITAFETAPADAAAGYNSNCWNGTQYQGVSYNGPGTQGTSYNGTQPLNGQVVEIEFPVPAITVR
jgi:hypothetical protein